MITYERSASIYANLCNSHVFVIANIINTIIIKLCKIVAIKRMNDTITDLVMDNKIFYCH